MTYWSVTTRLQNQFSLTWQTDMITIQRPSNAIGLKLFCFTRSWLIVTFRDRNKNDLKPTYSIHGCYRLITCFIAEDAFHYHLEHKRFKDEYKGNSTNETHGTPFELSWVSSLPVKPYNASNFTWGLVGFWNETRAAERGFSRNGSSKEYFM